MADQASSPLGPPLLQPGVRRYAIRLLESAQHLVFAQAGQRGELGERRRVRRIVGKAIAHLPDLAARFANRRGRGVAIQKQRAASTSASSQASVSA